MGLINKKTHEHPQQTANRLCTDFATGPVKKESDYVQKNHNHALKTKA